ncbi:MAG: thioredoxin reductase [Candidatus Parvarchaeum acidiphilum ARMAN-4]|jgi:thioredoxin reductase (NADPH)|uniref:Thioredoxin reductase n=1 Tax=Candidatus Parvarchaeum acidiphilum ARMAN-4 TaxID=662760 RepID=D2EEM7_PARA4|nr:MAG: thioredoxin reductase [Candidatus Parvarchaeum acidiphilum ARMAN-4]
MVEKLIIIGSGPAGYTAAIYANRDNLNPLLIRGFEVGGQLMLTSAVENFPGFKSILGPDLMDKLADQVKALNSRVIDDNVSKVDLNVYPYKVFVGDKEYETYSIIISTGASAKWLGFDNEKRLIGKGVSGCAVCDGPFFRNKKVVVVGGGDSAMEDASYLSTLTSSVTLIHRRHEFRASKIMQEKVLSNKKIDIIWDSEVFDIIGEDHVEGVRIKNLKTNEKSELKTDGLFIAIGHIPNTSIFKGYLDIDENGYIKTHDFTKTSKEGVFAAGDVQDKHYKQAVIAAGWGSMCAIDARKFLEEKNLN